MHDLSASLLKMLIARLLAVAAAGGMAYLLATLLAIDPVMLTVVASLVALIKLGITFRSHSED